MVNILKIRNRNRGMGVIDAGIGLLISILALIIVFKAVTEGTYRYKKYQLTNQFSEINSGADNWKGMRSNFNGVSMTKLCAAGQQSVSSQTCGGVGGSGANANAFGGNWSIEANTSNLSQKKITMTNLPSERINELADTFAAMSLNECQEANNCSTLSVSSNTITVTK